MPTLYENRKAHLGRLITKHDGADGRGGSSIVAKLSGVAASTISQIMLELPVQSAVGEKRRPGAVHQMGDAVARKIEIAFGMSEGTMDRPVTVQMATGLSPAQRDLLVTLEAMMLSGCLADEECAVEKSRLQRTYPIHTEGFGASGVRVMYAGNNALLVAAPH